MNTPSTPSGPPEHSDRNVEPHEAIVDGFTHGGEGVARVDGKAVFVAGTIPGERVTFRIVDERRRWARGELVDVVEPSQHRVTPPCPYAHACGGCDLQHIDPGEQRSLKTRVVTEQLQRLGGIADPPVADCRPVGDDTGYRRHTRMHADPGGHLGFHRAGTHDVVPVDRCLVLADDVQRLRDQVGDATGAAAVALRSGDDGAVVVLAPGPGPLELPDGPFDVLLEQPDGRTVPLRGDGRLRQQVGGFAFEIGATSFFQVSPQAAGALVDEVMASCGDVGGALVWDLYAGVGLFALPLARAGAEVIAVEGHREAAGHLADNARANELTVRVAAESVERFVRQAAGHDEPDIVVLDPPRTGAGAEVVSTLAGAGPGRIVYVACDVAALARDAHTLVDAGYRLSSAVPLDVFPMTHHVETVATFTR